MFSRAWAAANLGFNGHPPLGVNATDHSHAGGVCPPIQFQWAPTLGGECYYTADGEWLFTAVEFQWAPTLGGECYLRYRAVIWMLLTPSFNGHPPLGVNATVIRSQCGWQSPCISFNRHPPLGVNATDWEYPFYGMLLLTEFQWAPTLGGECYRYIQHRHRSAGKEVSMGTHP